MLASVEVYDPATETSTLAAPLPEPRVHHTATLLPNGEVLVAGGGQGSEISIPTGDGVLASAVVYDPARDAWRATGGMSGKRAGHNAVALDDGRVLVVGGGDRVGYPCASGHANCMIATSIGTAEIYDPATGAFSTTGALAQPRLAFTLDRLGDGRVVAAAGAAENRGLTSVEIFDPRAGTWSKGPPLEGQRLYHASAVLDGSLVVVGGKIANVAPLTATDVLDASANAWRRAASVNIPRTGAKLVPLASKHGLLVGGSNQLANQTLADARLYDAAADTWTSIEPLKRGRYGHAIVVLEDGSAIVVGGRDALGTIAAIERTR
jgi:N-acetylneuraminic acid mutarotase